MLQRDGVVWVCLQSGCPCQILASVIQKYCTCDVHTLCGRCTTSAVPGTESHCCLLLLFLSLILQPLQHLLLPERLLFFAVSSCCTALGQVAAQS
jgi:hypothetical protein